MLSGDATKQLLVASCSQRTCIGAPLGVAKVAEALVARSVRQSSAALCRKSC